MPGITAIYGSPRRKGNTSLLLKEAVRGARNQGAEVEELVLRDLAISPCLEIYGCKKDGRCVIKDDFHTLTERIMAGRGVMLASPIFFYAVSAHVKAMMDRSQSLWVKKYWIDKAPFKGGEKTRKALFISVGATSGKKLFDGALLSVRYWLDVFDAQLTESLLFRGLDLEGDVLKHPEYLEQAYQSGEALARSLA